MNNDLISRSELKTELGQYFSDGILESVSAKLVFNTILKIIGNAQTVEVPENEVNCVLTMFGKCSYNKTGCSDCEIKDKIRKALKERPQGEWGKHGECPFCSYIRQWEDDNFCGNCGAKMKGGKQ